MSTRPGPIRAALIWCGIFVIWLYAKKKDRQLSRERRRLHDAHVADPKANPHNPYSGVDKP